MRIALDRIDRIFDDVLDKGDAPEYLTWRDELDKDMRKMNGRN